MLLRPLLTASRADLRALLTSRSASWLEDPANADPRFLRSRARAALGLSPWENGEPAHLQRTAEMPRAPGCAQNGPSADCGGQLVRPAGLTARRSPHSTLAAALLSVSGQTTPPRGPRLADAACPAGGLDADVTATLSGARVEASGDDLLIAREPGRVGLPDLALPVNAPAIWDGRFEITTSEPGWRVGPLQGRMAALDLADQAIVKRLHPSARPALPVLFRDDDPRPVLAWRGAETRCLVADRLIAAAGGIGHEDQLTHSSGETPPADLFLSRSGG